MNYQELVDVLRQLLVMTDTYGQQFFDALLPTLIMQTEFAIYREPDFDFLATRTSDVSQITSTGVRTVPLPDKFIVLENVNLITPANATLATAGAKRVPLLRCDREVIDMTWPEASQTAPPEQYQTLFAIYSQQESNVLVGFNAQPNQIIIAPTPDNEYVVELLGTFQPPNLSETTNPITFLTAYYPDLFIAKAMFFATGELKKNYGQQASDPKEAVSWDMVYQNLKGPVAIQSYRQKSLVEGFSARPANATQPNVAALRAAAAAQQG